MTITFFIVFISSITVVWVSMELVKSAVKVTSKIPVNLDVTKLSNWNKICTFSFEKFGIFADIFLKSLNTLRPPGSMVEVLQTWIPSTNKLANLSNCTPSTSVCKVKTTASKEILMVQ